MGELIRQGTEYIIHLLERIGLSDRTSTNLGEFLTFLLLISISLAIYPPTWRLMRGIFFPILYRSKNKFDDLLVKNRFFRRLSFYLPALLIYYFAENTISEFPLLIEITQILLEIVFVVIGVLVADSILTTINDFYERYDFSKEHPIKGFIQIVKIITYILGFMVIIGTMFERDLGSLVISFGTLSAVLMLIFKDPILGLVGGMQLSFNKMLAIGDWITMPKYNADGLVLEINLTTVKVQNFDKTIITIPTYTLITDSFQNWRGMEEAGGRRIKRSINLDMNSVKFCTDEMLEKFKKIKILYSYINIVQKQVEEYNLANEFDTSVLVNGRRQTNIGVFRAYLKSYLMNLQEINTKMTFMVRQLQPTEKGIPMEIYAFAKTTEWEIYEEIQSDIFDHVLAVIPEFELKIYQYPNSGEQLFIQAMMEEN
jgi:miniconductance mechanosensitive channel